MQAKEKSYKKFVIRIALIIFVLAIIFSLPYVFAWTEPSVAPPGGNTDEPLNVSAITQYKSGALRIVNYFKTKTYTYLATLAGNVGIGTTTPPEKLTLEGGNFLHKADSPKFEGAFSNPSTINIENAVHISGKYAYVGGITVGGKDSMFIFDISNPSNPAYVGKYEYTAEPYWGIYDIKVAGKYAYIAADAPTYTDLKIIDISNPSNPTFVEKYRDMSKLKRARSLYINGKYAYIVGFDTDSLVIIDISNPYNPKYVGDYTNSTYLDGARGVYVSGNYAYVVAAYSDRLTIINIADPSAPYYVKDYYNSTYLDEPRSIYVSGGYAYIASYLSDSLTIIDISNPLMPTFMGSYKDSEHGTTYLNGATSLNVLGNYAYIAAQESDYLTIIDVSNPSTPTIAGYYTSADNLDLPRYVNISGKYAYVIASYSDSLTILDISGIDAPSASIGNIAASQINVSENMDIGNNLYVGSGLNVGSGGIKADGVITASSTDILRYLKAIPTPAPADCGSGNKGEIYYDNTQNAPCFCNGTNWVRFNNHAVICSS